MVVGAFTSISVHENMELVICSSLSKHAAGRLIDFVLTSRAGEMQEIYMLYKQPSF